MTNKSIVEKRRIEMKNLLKSGLILGFIFANTALPAIAETRGFYQPKITFRSGRTYRVSQCINSFRYQNPCTKNAGDEIAQEFCERKGYDSWTKWNSKDVGWNSRRTVGVYTDQYEDGDRWKGWKAQESSILMDFIECST